MKRLSPGGHDPPDEPVRVYTAYCRSCHREVDDDAIDSRGRCFACNDRGAGRARSAAISKSMRQHRREIAIRLAAERAETRIKRNARRRFLYRQRRDRERLALGLPLLPPRDRRGHHRNRPRQKGNSHDKH